METGVSVGASVLGNSARNLKLSVRAEVRAIGVLADPLVLKQAGAAAPLLAMVNERCGEGNCCRIKYTDVARDLGVSVTTVKTWAETLEHLGFFKREPCGPSGVDLRLDPERWPNCGTGTAMDAVVSRLVNMLDAVQVTIGGALESAKAEVRRVREAA